VPDMWGLDNKQNFQVQFLQIAPEGYDARCFSLRNYLLSF